MEWHEPVIQHFGHRGQRRRSWKSALATKWVRGHPETWKILTQKNKTVTSSEAIITVKGTCILDFQSKSSEKNKTNERLDSSKCAKYFLTISFPHLHSVWKSMILLYNEVWEKPKLQIKAVAVIWEYAWLHPVTLLYLSTWNVPSLETLCAFWKAPGLPLDQPSLLLATLVVSGAETF